MNWKRCGRKQCAVIWGRLESLHKVQCIINFEKCAKYYTVYNEYYIKNLTLNTVSYTLNTTYNVLCNAMYELWILEKVHCIIYCMQLIFSLSRITIIAFQCLTCAICCVLKYLRLELERRDYLKHKSSVDNLFIILTPYSLYV